MVKKQFRYMILLGAFAVATTACAGKDSAKSYYKAGVEQLEAGQYQEASDNFKKAIEKQDDKAEYYLSDGTALIKLGEYEEALTTLDQAIVDIDSSITDKNKKKALRLKGIAYYYMDDYNQAISSFTEAKELDAVKELNEDINGYLAECLLIKERYAEAIAIYDEMIEADSKSATAYAMRGKAQAAAGDTEKAKEDFQQAIKLEKKNYAYYCLAYETLKEAGDTEAAQSILSEVSSLSAKSNEEQYYVAKLQYYQGQMETAIETLNAIVEDYNEAYELLGEIYFADKDYNRAIDCYVTYLGGEKDAIDTKVYYELALCYVETKEYESALEYIRTGLQSSDKMYERELKYEEIHVLEELTQFSEAYELAKKYVEIYPEDEAMQREVKFLETR